ncbi:hypothetical protein [Lactobacillus brevis] [Lactiplantibacillus mudanjiangensis]|uniref:glycosyltransferase family 2 protein n=1 Tax=Lactiplantibacillus mudanjiangensis TaxID=1296538 RepID=UPI00101477AD|nr:glycosyltransferase [Lactiplantibacillus mudanjiangensis]VDG32747.1 hypothetical protein [Lactobacillus brevis] [Lactiplantibacillus mudanjiangensis]
MKKENLSFVTVIVTYGSKARFSNLSRTIDSAFKGGTTKVFLINNGCEYDLHQCIVEDFPTEKIDVFDFEVNQGSLVGFRTGLELVLKDSKVSNNDYVLILDDDVILDSQFKKNFIFVENKLNSVQRHIWSLFREGRDGSVSEKFDKNSKYYQNSIAGFSVFQRFTHSVTMRKDNLGHPFFIPWAGTFICKKDLATIKIPKVDYFVYEDDADFSLNIREQGYEIYRSYDLKLRESSSSWFENGRKTESGYKLFYDVNNNPGRFLYKIRNNVFLIKNRMTTNGLLFYVNIFIFILAGFIRYGIFARHGVSRLFQLCAAVRDGMSGHLGENRNWKL